MGEAERGEQAQDDMGGGEGLCQRPVLLVEWRHGGPVVVHVGHAVRLQDLPIARAEEGGVAHLDRVGRAGGEQPEKALEPVEERCRIDAPALELEDEGAELLAEPFLRRFEDEVAEGAGIQEPLAGFAGLGAIAGQVGIGRDRELFPHFGTEPEIVRHLRRIVGQLLGARRPVEGMVDTDGAEERDVIDRMGRIFRERVLTEAALRVGPVIDEALPAFVGPGTAAESDGRIAGGHDYVFYKIHLQEQ